MNGILIPLVAAGIVFVTIVYVGVLLTERRNNAAKRRSLALVAGYAAQDPHTAIVAAEANESLIRASMLGLGRRLVGPSARERIERNALYSGNNKPDAVDSVVVRKVLLGALGVLLGLLLGLASGGLWWLTLPAFAVMGFFVPDLLIYNEGLKRDEEMGRRLPDALDMLNLCVESGLSFQAALAQVANNQKGPVAEEFASALREMQFGRSRSEALVALAGRTRQEDVQRFVSAMLQVDKLGVPVATVLREQAKEMRAKRYDRAREMAQKVPVKILMPLMLCFLPCLFIIILGPAAYSIYKALSGS